LPAVETESDMLLHLAELDHLLREFSCPHIRPVRYVNSKGVMLVLLSCGATS